MILVAPGVAGATDLFGVEATYSGGTITQTASSLPDLVEALVNNQGAFTPLVGNNFTGSLTYYGIPDAVAVDVQGDTQLTVTSSLTGLNRTFTGTDRNDLEDQLTDWLLKEGNSEVSKLMQAVAEQSAAAITDGNPSSATARMADRAFGTFGLFRPPASCAAVNRATTPPCGFIPASPRPTRPSGPWRVPTTDQYPLVAEFRPARLPDRQSAAVSTWTPKAPRSTAAAPTSGSASARSSAMRKANSAGRLPPSSASMASGPTTAPRADC